MITGSEKDLRTLADLLGISGLECPKDTEEFSQAYTRLFVHRNHAEETQFRFFIDKRARRGTLKIKKRRRLL